MEELPLRQSKAAINQSPWKPIKYLRAGLLISGKALHCVDVTVVLRASEIINMRGSLMMTDFPALPVS